MLGVPKKSSGRNKSVTIFADAKIAPLLSAAYFGVIEELELRSSSSITPR